MEFTWLVDHAPATIPTADHRRAGWLQDVVLSISCFQVWGLNTSNVTNRPEICHTAATRGDLALVNFSTVSLECYNMAALIDSEEWRNETCFADLADCRAHGQRVLLRTQCTSISRESTALFYVVLTSNFYPTSYWKEVWFKIVALTRIQRKSPIIVELRICAFLF